MTEKAPQRGFKSLDEFIDGMGNFRYYFHVDSPFIIQKIKRNRPVYQRFKKQHPELDQTLTLKVTESEESIVKTKRTIGLPYEELFEAYQLMSELVFVGDEHTLTEGYLLR